MSIAGGFHARQRRRGETVFPQGLEEDRSRAGELSGVFTTKE